MRQHWQLQEAKNHFSEVVEKALNDGPQVVTKRGLEAVVVLSVDTYKKLTKPKVGLVDFFRQSPLKGINLDLERVKDSAREVEL
ncbi:MAG: type II toxin-antitoxin system Phd/YefM family antitoxin [SAR324 cluster bacterium]|nr:type II toxin-antitoxin system Phd/YefM family antitoxin [SAR324 cluster bacterium]